MPEVIVIGAANTDIGAFSQNKLVARDSNPGAVTVSLGGVGRNIAHNLCLLGVDTAMITVLGEDRFGEHVRRTAGEIGLDLRWSAVIPGGRTGTYVYIADHDGDMALAVSDMAIYEQMTPDFLAARLDFINSARLVVMDANLPSESIRWLCDNCTVPVVADPVSAAKAEKLRPVLSRLYAIKPNRLEASLLSGVTVETEADAATAARKLLDTGLQQVYISLSADGIYAADRQGQTARRGCPRVAAVSATGCGDAMVAALSACILRGEGLERTARVAMAAGAFAATAETTIHPAMSWESIGQVLESEV